MSQSSAHITVIFIGIAGPSGCGKSTYAKHLAEHLHSPLHPIQLDHFFYNPLIINHRILGQIKSYEQPECLDHEEFFNLLHQIKQNPKQITKYHREDTLINEDKPIVIIIEGFLLFALSDKITNLFDIRIFLDSTLSECRVHRYCRRNKILHTIPNENIIVTKEFQQWFDHLVWDEYLKHRDLQITKAGKVFHSNEYQQKQYTLLDDYIVQRVSEIIIEKNRTII
jgi:uridine kinase